MRRARLPLSRTYSKRFLEHLLNELHWALNRSDFQIDFKGEYDVIVQYIAGGMTMKRITGSQLYITAFQSRQKVCTVGVLPSMGYRVAYRTREREESPRLRHGTVVRPCWYFVYTPNVKVADDLVWNWQGRMKA